MPQAATAAGFLAGGRFGHEARTARALPPAAGLVGQKAVGTDTGA